MDLESSFDRADRSPNRPRLSEPLIEDSPLPMVELAGSAHRICFVNRAFCELLQQKPSDMVGKPFAEIVFNGANCVPLLDRIYQTGEFQTHAEADGSESSPAYWLYAMWPTLGASSPSVRVVIQLTRSAEFRQNVTEINEALLIAGLRQHELREKAEQSNLQLQLEIAGRKRVEEALREAKAQLRADAATLEETVAERTAQLRASMGELEAFSYSLVHDLRAPVRAIQGFTTLALEMPNQEVGPAAAAVLDRVVKAALRMDSLIQDVLSLNEVILQPIETMSVDLDALVKTLLAEGPEFSAFSQDIKTESPLLRMQGHEALLSQCLNNLLANAVKFVVPTKRPQIRIYSEERFDPVELEASPLFPSTVPARPPTVRLWIEDQGIGIAREEHERIFQIFQRLNSSSKYEGTGIGLAIVQKAVERMKGRLGLESVLGQGSRFWIELPKG